MTAYQKWQFLCAWPRCYRNAVFMRRYSNTASLTCGSHTDDLRNASYVLLTQLVVDKRDAGQLVSFFPLAELSERVDTRSLTIEDVDSLINTNYLRKGEIDYTIAERASL